ncbi:AIR synthase [Parapusillimonas sp. SGNA-6]|nr:AIR synthase [Parapedobacter sp. SGR-10]NGM89230.1 AIR synthase [Parapusillimonas sp. SGNA-6]
MYRDGKLDPVALKAQFIEKTGFRRQEVLQGPSIGVDVSVIKIDEKTALIAASDPLSILPSLSMEISAWLSVHLMANDVATTGFLPNYGQFVLNLPTSLSSSQIQNYWNSIDQYCKEIGVHITGGHTAFDSFTQSTIAGGGTLFAIAPVDEVKTSSLAQAGDDLLMTKSAALSSSSLLAWSFPDYIKKHVGDEIRNQAQASFFETSIIPEVKVLQEDQALFSQVHAMHDVTEKGIIGASHEFAQASNTCISLFEENIRVAEPQRQVCKLFKIDPLRSIGAGSLLIACNPHYTDKIITKLGDVHIEATHIGRFNSRPDLKSYLQDQNGLPIPYPVEDPYWAAYFTAYKNNLS